MAGVEGQGPFLPAALYQVSCRLLGCWLANMQPGSRPYAWLCLAVWLKGGGGGGTPFECIPALPPPPSLPGPGGLRFRQGPSVEPRCASSACCSTDRHIYLAFMATPCGCTVQ